MPRLEVKLYIFSMQDVIPTPLERGIVLDAAHNMVPLLPFDHKRPLRYGSRRPKEGWEGDAGKKVSFGQYQAHCNSPFSDQSISSFHFSKITTAIYRSFLTFLPASRFTRYYPQKKSHLSTYANSHYEADPVLTFCVSGILPRLFAARKPLPQSYFSKMRIAVQLILLPASHGA